MNHDGTDPWTEEEKTLAFSNQLIPALKAYIARTGCSLSQGKRSIDRLRFGGPSDAPSQMVSKEDLRIAVNEFCSCGGKGPQDPGACPACLVWHRCT